MKHGKCALCLDSGDLCNSHIISEFNYAALYDSNHRFIRLSNRGPKHKSLDQKGYREPLLCADCEAKLSRWEKYAKKILHDGGIKQATRNEFGFTFEGIVYEKFRLYLLSLLWRMGVSRLPMFSVVELGPHMEPLRLALLEEDPLEPDSYPCILSAVTIGGRFQNDLIVPPSVIKTDQQRAYRTVITGIIHTFYVGSHPTDPKLSEMAITREGRIKVPVSKIEEVEWLYVHILTVRRAAKAAGAI